MKSLQEFGEFGLIERLNAGLKVRRGVKIGIGDDAAVLDGLAAPIVTTDALVEGVHFRRDWTSPRLLGQKALAVNLSDIAAMGGRPVAAFVALAAAKNEDPPFLEEIYAGMEELAAQYEFSVAGGDTVASPGALMLCVTLVGNAPTPILRSGAKKGDLLLVTGTLGDAAAGLQLLLRPKMALEAMAHEKTARETTAREWVLVRHHAPTPRLREIWAAVEAFPGAIHAALDLSDGLVGDARHLAKKSGVGLEIWAEKLPISSACHATAKFLGALALDWALAGGEDYELLLAVAPEEAEKLAAAIEEATRTPVSIVGRCVQGAAVRVLKNGEEIPVKRAWEHF